MSEPLKEDKSKDRNSVEASSNKLENIAKMDHQIESLLSETDCRKSASNQCKCKHAPDRCVAAFMNLLPPEYWESYGQTKVGDSSDEAKTIEQANKAINEAFIKRLQELEKVVPNAMEAKLETYKEWVSVLQRLNKELLNDFDDFQTTIEDQLHAHASRSDFKHKRDVTSLVRLIRQAFHHRNWSLADIKFETMTPAYVMGLDEGNPTHAEILNNLHKREYPPVEQSSVLKKLSNTNMNVNFMALAIEVAEKHDEIISLKKRLCSLEDEIQNAQKKIQLKDDVIREMRCDLKKFLIQDKSNTSIINTNSSRNDMVPIATENMTELSGKMPPTAMSNNAVSKINSSESWAMAENLECLKNQLEEILSSSNSKSENPKNEAERLRDIFMKLETDKNEAFEKLWKIKETFLDILKSEQRDEQTITNLASNDEVLLQAVRDHIESLTAARKELSNQVQELLIQKGETAGQIKALNNMNRVNCDALKELADLLSSMTNEAVNYEVMYSNPNCNPFCQAVCNLKENLSKTIDELKAQLAAEKTKQKRNQALVDRDKNDGSTDTTNSWYDKNRSATQPTTSPQQHLPSIAPIPHPRTKKLSKRKI